MVNPNILTHHHPSNPDTDGNDETDETDVTV